MSHNRLDLIGAIFGKLTVVSEAPRRATTPSGNRPRYWLCRCECGGSTETTTGCLRSGNTRSCGCGISAATEHRNFKHGLGGAQRPPEYEVWRAMRRRCRNPRGVDYKYYGARGIDVCERWEEFPTFYADMGPRPSAAHSIDRVDVDAGYSPENCKWATATEQRRNRRDYIERHGRAA